MKKILISLAVVFGAFYFLQSAGKGASSLDKLTGYAPQQKMNPDKGIGPFKNVTLEPVDKAKARTGMIVFTNKCALCHELDVKKVGPPLRQITKTAEPEFILNMIVNPLEMQKNDATVKELMRKYNNVPMLDQQISHPDALAILDYLRSVAK